MEFTNLPCTDHHHSSILFTEYAYKVIYHYQKLNKVRTAETYLTTVNSFQTFLSGSDVYICDITQELLQEYEAHLYAKNLQSNTISFYMKHLRAIYNRAVDDSLVVDIHPFKRVNTSIASTPKRALSLRTIKRIKNLNLDSSPVKRFARDMFMFSFYTRGMSFVDIAYLKKKNLTSNLLCYRRRKTGQQLEMTCEKCILDILDRYSAEPSSPYLLSIIDPCIANHRRQYLSASSLVNRHLRDIGQQLSLSHPLTMYCARHSWASIAYNEGIPISIICEGMGHDSEKTTRIYLAKLKSDTIDRANRKILRLL